jgi:hypothetical protein
MCLKAHLHRVEFDYRVIKTTRWLDYPVIKPARWLVRTFVPE